MTPDPLESELRKLQLRPASEELRNRLEMALRPTTATSGVIAKPRQSWMGWGWLLAGAMSVALVISVIQTPQAIPGSGKNAVFDSGSARIVATALRDVRDEGLVFDVNGQPLRQVRLLTDETMSWQSRQTGARLQISYPREDTEYVPVSGN